MKQAVIAILMLAFLGSARAGEEKPIWPTGFPTAGDGYCVSVKGVTWDPISRSGISCSPIAGPRDLATQKLAVQGALLAIGWDMVNGFGPWSYPLTDEQLKRQEWGRKIMAAALSATFPELGEPRSDASCYCGKDVTGEPDFDADPTRKTPRGSRGGCSDWMSCFVKGVPGSPQ